MMKVKLYNKIANEGIARFDANTYEFSEDFDTYDAIMVRSAKLHDVEFSEDLKCIARAGAGVNNIPIDRCSEQGIVVFNTPGANANAVKELVIASLILAGRKIVQGSKWLTTLDSQDLLKNVEKGKAAFTGPEIAGKKLGVIGLGAIGVQVANAAAALDMDVYGYDPFISVDAAWTLKARIHHARDLKTVLEQCDYITLHLPCNEQTKNMIDEERISWMKDGVRLLNFARDGLVNEEAMKKALDCGKIATYVSDFATPLLYQHEHVVAIPHLGASTYESELNCARMAADEVIDYLENGNIKNAINLPNMQMVQEAKNRICIINENIPNMINKITSGFSDNGINIENMANKAKASLAYTLIETNDDIDDALLEKIKAEPGIKKVRVITK